MKTFKQFNESINITSTTGNKVVIYFETGQGSKYLMTDKGETKRWKSVHGNTGGDAKLFKNSPAKSLASLEIDTNSSNKSPAITILSGFIILNSS